MIDAYQIDHDEHTRHEHIHTVHLPHPNPITLSLPVGPPLHRLLTPSCENQRCPSLNLRSASIPTIKPTPAVWYLVNNRAYEFGWIDMHCVYNMYTIVLMMYMFCACPHTQYTILLCVAAGNTGTWVCESGLYWFGLAFVVSPLLWGGALCTCGSGRVCYRSAEDVVLGDGDRSMG
ncbi:hypothetical protein T440DRAFT_211872 [Plenodomus tracheiphilus IPT5]|uniref:Uncharacterized protein n=1 Tax=Plenodomus tracheiphilus IPT5 TaxID=1408161 RepID=A0A6A7AVH2_9PLEO|nr:hypothetical protein T440DRAFT_211872 [Plenodomus tracheiphilus IPT5]